MKRQRPSSTFDAKADAAARRAKMHEENVKSDQLKLAKMKGSSSSNAISTIFTHRSNNNGAKGQNDSWKYTYKAKQKPSYTKGADYDLEPNS